MGGSLVLSPDDPRWAAFVESRPDATPFHHPSWARLLGECYGFRTFAFALEDGGELVAGVPVAEVRSLTGRRSWVALPFTDELAPLGPADRRAALVADVDAERTRAGVASLELRSEIAAGVRTIRGTSHMLELRDDPNELLRTFSRSQVQRNIARAEREGVVVRAGGRDVDLLETFYTLHLDTRRRQGIPIQPRRFFSLLWERVIATGLGTLLIAEVGGRPVAAAVFMAWSRRVVYKFGASDSRAWGSRPNHALFWEAIRRACAAGMREFEFGRTDLGHEGLRAFKAGWGTHERQLVYTTFGARPSSAAQGPMKSALGVAIRHSPRWVCRVLGETLYRYAA